MGEARLLWEIGPGGADVRALRTKLGLDSAYVSRLLHSLEGHRLVRVRMLEPLTGKQRASLVAAVAEVDRLVRKAPALTRGSHAIAALPGALPSAASNSASAKRASSSIH